MHRFICRMLKSLPSRLCWKAVDKTRIAAAVYGGRRIVALPDAHPHEGLDRIEPCRNPRRWKRASTRLANSGTSRPSADQVGRPTWQLDNPKRAAVAWRNVESLESFGSNIRLSSASPANGDLTDGRGASGGSPPKILPEVIQLSRILFLAAAFCGFILAAAPGETAALPLMPMPARLSMGSGSLTIDSRFSIAISGYSDQRLEAAAMRLLARISRQTGVPIPRQIGKGGSPAALVIACKSAGSAPPKLYEDESYQLEIAASGARLSAPTVTGALRGMATFVQLIAPGPDAFTVPAVRIEDKPRFPWRGLMIDSSRHWMPLPVILRNLEAMAAVKLNVLHWHLSDDQGFRVESKIYPKLQQEGSDGLFYTQDQIRRVVAFARDRGIRVVPEFDMPGHSLSWLVGYPELASAPGPYEIGRHWGIFDAVMDPTREETYNFLDSFIGEMAGLFPDEYFHIGGDEVRANQWNQNTAIQAFCKAHNLAGAHDLQAYFNKRIQAIVQKHGKIMIGWDEILHPDLPKDIVVQSWRGQESLAQGARRGYRGLLSFGYYLDHLSPASYHYGIDPLGDGAQELNAEEAARILGGEACMWAELVNAETVDSRIWPRMAAIAERLWSPAELRDVDSMYARLSLVSRGLDWTGVQHRSTYWPMLDRLTGGRSTGQLKVLSDVVEPQGLRGRHPREKTTSTPLNRLVDAARAESESVRALSQAARKIVEEPGNSAAERAWVRQTFLIWRDNDARLQPLLQNNFLLKETAPLSKDLSRAGTIGLQALRYVESKRPAPARWVSQQKQALDRMEKPQAEVTLAAVRPVRILVEAVSRTRASGQSRRRPAPRKAPQK